MPQTNIRNIELPVEWLLVLFALQMLAAIRRRNQQHLTNEQLNH